MCQHAMRQPVVEPGTAVHGHMAATRLLNRLYDLCHLRDINIILAKPHHQSVIPTVAEGPAVAFRLSGTEAPISTLDTLPEDSCPLVPTAFYAQ